MKTGCGEVVDEIEGRDAAEKTSEKGGLCGQVLCVKLGSVRKG